MASAETHANFAASPEVAYERFLGPGTQQVRLGTAKAAAAIVLTGRRAQ